MNTLAPLAPVRLDPLLNRLPSSVAWALFRGDDWLSTSDLGLTTAIEAAAPNTRTAWACDWAVFRAWALGPAARVFPEEGTRVRLPVLPEVLVRFVSDLFAGTDVVPPRARATVQRYLSTLSTLHRLLDLPDPTKAQIVRNTLKARTRGSGGQDQAAPLRWTEVQAAITLLTADPDDLRGLRDATLLAVGHNTMARRAELVALDVADLEFSDDGSALVLLRPTKLRLEAEPDPRFIGPVTAALTRTWIARANLSAGPLFTGFRAGGRGGVPLRHTGQRLAPPEVNTIVKLAAARLALARGELSPPQGTGRARRQVLLAFAAAYSGHSLRVGAAQDLAAAGVSTAAILQAGGWTDERMVRRYLRKLRAQEGGMAQFLAAGA